MTKSLFDTTSWGIQTPSVAILVPTRDVLHTHFAYSLTQLIKTSTEAGIETFLFFDLNTILLTQREKLIEKAKEVESDYVLWLDSDMIFPPTTLLRLLNHNKDIVGCNYMKRSLPQKTVAYRNIKDWNSNIPLKQMNTLIEADVTGLGCVLMKTTIFNKIKKPYFEFSFNEKTNDWLGEDFNLFKKFRQVNNKLYIDTTLSLDIKHIGSYAFGVDLSETNKKI